MKLFIGNKPYSNIDISDIIDDFNENVRFNMHIINKNNGTKCDKLACCSHVWKSLNKCFNFTTNKHTNTKHFLINGYKHCYKIEMLNYFYDNFKPNLYSKIYYQKVIPVNNFLKSIQCPFIHKSQPRTGFLSIINELIKNTQNKHFVTHFTIDNTEIRNSLMVTEKASLIESTGCHLNSKEYETNILRWLHKNNYIDITLCMLEDTNIPTLNCKGLIPSEYILNKLKTKFKTIKII